LGHCDGLTASSMSAMAETARARACRTMDLRDMSTTKNQQMKRTKAPESDVSATRLSAVAEYPVASSSIIVHQQSISAFSARLQPAVGSMQICQRCCRPSYSSAHSLIRAGRRDFIQSWNAGGFLVVLGVELGGGLVGVVQCQLCLRKHSIWIGPA